MADAPVVLDGFGLSFADQVVFSELDLRVQAQGVHLLMGPVGVGKSALLRTLCGLNRAQPAMRTWGRCACDPQRLSLVAQNARFLISTVRENLCEALSNRAALTRAQQVERIVAELQAVGLLTLADALERDVIELPACEQRMLAVVRAALGAPAVLCLDEPTSGLEPQEADRVVALVRHYAAHLGVLMVTHDRRVARDLEGTLTVVAGGRAQDHGATRRVLDAPAPGPAEDFVRSGSCRVPSPNTPAELLTTDAPKAPPLPKRARVSMRRARGPRHFYWLLEGQLGGLPRPGVIADLEADVRGLRELGVRVLYTLEEQRTVPEALLEAEGIESRWMPIVDMDVPQADAMLALCEELEGLIAGGLPVAVHCLAGLGRTGTVLACVLIARGETASVALERVRALRTWAVQSAAQHEFLVHFERYVRSQRADPSNVERTKRLA